MLMCTLFEGEWGLRKCVLYTHLNVDNCGSAPNNYYHYGLLEIQVYLGSIYSTKQVVVAPIAVRHDTPSPTLDEDDFVVVAEVNPSPTPDVIMQRRQISK